MGNHYHTLRYGLGSVLLSVLYIITGAPWIAMPADARVVSGLSETQLPRLKKGEILVDKKKRKDPKFGVGIFNVIEIPALKRAWRAIPKKGLSFIEIPKTETNLKICKINNLKTCHYFGHTYLFR